MYKQKKDQKQYRRRSCNDVTTMDFEDICMGKTEKEKKTLQYVAEFEMSAKKSRPVYKEAKISASKKVSRRSSDCDLGRGGCITNDEIQMLSNTQPKQKPLTKVLNKLVPKQIRQSSESLVDLEAACKALEAVSDVSIAAPTAKTNKAPKSKKLNFRRWASDMGTSNIKAIHEIDVDPIEGHHSSCNPNGSGNGKVRTERRLSDFSIDESQVDRDLEFERQSFAQQRHIPHTNQVDKRRQAEEKIPPSYKPARRPRKCPPHENAPCYKKDKTYRKADKVENCQQNALAESGSNQFRKTFDSIPEEIDLCSKSKKSIPEKLPHEGPVEKKMPFLRLDSDMAVCG
jgi:hypothetical protein